MTLDKLCDNNDNFTTNCNNSEYCSPAYTGRRGQTGSTCVHCLWWGHSGSSATMYTQWFTRVCINYLALQLAIAAEPQADNQKIYLLLVTYYTTQQQLFYGPLSGTTRVSRYQKKHSSTHHPHHHPIFISFFHPPWSIASFLFKLCAWQSFCTTSLHVFFGLPLGLEPSTSYFIHFVTQSVCFLQHMPTPSPPVLL